MLQTTTVYKIQWNFYMFLDIIGPGRGTSFSKNNNKTNTYCYPLDFSLQLPFLWCLPKRI